MSERTFRVVISALLAGALVLAVVVVIAVLPHLAALPPQPTPGVPVATGGAAGPTPPTTSSAAPSSSPTQATIPAPVIAAQVVGVGQIARGASSARTLVLQFTETSDAAIPDAPGSFRVTLTDHAGDGSTVAFEGVPMAAGPDSLGATAVLVAPNVLEVSIVASDTRNIESIGVTGLGIRASATAALGAVTAQLGQFTGSLAGGVTNSVLGPPGDVVAGQ